MSTLAQRRAFLNRTGALLRPMGAGWRCELPRAPLFGWGATAHAAVEALRTLLRSGATTL